MLFILIAGWSFLNKIEVTFLIMGPVSVIPLDLGDLILDVFFKFVVDYL